MAGKPVSPWDPRLSRTTQMRSCSQYAHRKASLDSYSSRGSSSSSFTTASSMESFKIHSPRGNPSMSRVRRTPPRNSSPNYSVDRMLASNPYTHGQNRDAYRECSSTAHKTFKHLFNN